MEVLLVLVPFVVAGLAVIFIAFSGGPAAAREAYLPAAGAAFKIGIPLLYILLGAVVPAVVIASRGEAEGGVGKLRTTRSPPRTSRRARSSSARPAGAVTPWTRSMPRA